MPPNKISQQCNNVPVILKRSNDLGFHQFAKKGRTFVLFIRMAAGQPSRIMEIKDVPYGLLLKIIRYDLKMDVKAFFEP